MLGVPGGAHADVEWDVAALAALDAAGHGVRELLVTENKTSFRAVPAADGRLIVWGAGYGVDELLSAVPWRHAVAVRYWGDLDTQGFAILSALRAVAPHTTSLLMDVPTLLAHKPFWGREHAPRTDELPHLLPPEAEAYDALRTHAYGPAVRLEQEFIRFDLVAAALGRLCQVPEHVTGQPDECAAERETPRGRPSQPPPKERDRVASA